jgi:DNA-binding NarL/FixJ family response regulator
VTRDARPDAVQMRRVQLIDRPGFSHDVIASLIAELPDTELVSDTPDVIVIDDLELTGALASLDPDIPVVVLGADDHPAYAARARRIGAQWVAKDAAATVLPRALNDRH